jgi:hypothetical protein
MFHDDVISELWQIKDEIAAECNYDIHALVKSLREDESKYPCDLPILDAINHPATPRP